MGPVVVAGPGGEVALGGPQRRLILAVLLAAREDGCSVDMLLDALWGDRPPAASMAVLHAAISRLRKLLEPDRRPRAPATLIRSTAQGYALDLGLHTVDADTFVDLVDAGRAALADGDPAEAKHRLTEAEALWRGAAYGDLADHHSLEASAAALEEERLGATELLAEARLMLGEHDELVGELETRVRRHPYRERSWAHLLLALYRSGRQADALSAYQRCRRHLVSELGIEPGPALQELNNAILLQRPELASPATTSPEPAVIDLPAPRTRFVGRDMEVTDLVDAIKAHRLVTVTGPAGVGKSRLAIEVARLCHPAFHHGTAYCELTTAPSGGAVEAAIASAVGVRTTAASGADSLVEHLRTRELLLVLDDADHALADTAALVDRLLARCPQLRVLTTTSVPLGTTGERLVRVAPLPHSDPADPACALFRDRAALAAAPGELDDAAVVTACNRLGGLPLALELAAARLRSMPLEQLLAGLDERLTAISASTLSEVVDWSVGLLDDEQQALLRRLSVFAGGCDAPAAEVVCEPQADVEQALAALVDRSLVELELRPDGARYRLLPPIRADGLVRLDETGERADLEDRHLAWCLALAPDAPGHGEDPAVVAPLGQESVNVAAALARGFQRPDVGPATRLAIVATPLWVHTGRFTDAAGWLERAVDRSGADPDARRRALWWLGWVLARQGRFAVARERLEQSLDLAVEADDAGAVAASAVLLGSVEIESGDLVAGDRRLASYDELPGDHADRPLRARRWHALGIRALQAGELDLAADLLGRAAHEARAAGMWHTLVRALTSQAQSESGRRHYPRADGALAEGLSLARRHHLVGLLPRLLGVQAVLRGRQGEWAEARSLFDQAVAAARHAGDSRVELISLINLGVVDLREDQPIVALERLEEADALARATGDERQQLMIAPVLAEAIVFGTHDTDRALAVLREVVDRAQRAGIQVATIQALEAAALALVDRDRPGDTVAAAHFFGACATAREARDLPEDTARSSPLESARTSIRARLGDQPADTAFDEGRRQDLDSAADELRALR